MKAVANFIFLDSKTTADDDCNHKIKRCLLLDLHIGFSRGRLGGLVFPSLSGFSTVSCNPHSQRLWHSQAEIDVFLELSCFFHDPANVGNLTSGSAAFSKTSLNIREFTVHVLLKPGLENFEHYFTSIVTPNIKVKSKVI